MLVSYNAASLAANSFEAIFVHGSFIVLDDCQVVLLKIEGLSSEQQSVIMQRLPAIALTTIHCALSKQQLADLVDALRKASSSLDVALRAIALALPVPTKFITQLKVKPKQWYEAFDYPYNY